MIRTALAVVGVMLAALASTTLAQDGRSDGTILLDRKPNVLLIIADDMRADALGAAGNEKIHTPNLDAFAKRSVYFTSATCFVAQCCPWRAMMVTGLAPHQSGYTSIDLQQGKRGQPDGFSDLPTMPGLLRDAGYRTVLVGKWHILPDPWKCGFTEVRKWFPEGMGPYSDPKLCCGESRKAETVPGFVTEIFADDAIEFLKTEGAGPGWKDRPFFLWLASTAPHEPCEPTPQRIGEMYKGVISDDLVLPGIEKGASARWRDKWLPYYCAVTHLDEQVGRVLRTLEEKGLAESTVVIFVSDSGIMMGRRGIDSKVVPYEESVRAPIMVFDPRRGRESARRSAAPVSAIDLPPTILAMAGLKAPATWPGRTLTSLLAGNGDGEIKDAVCEWVDDGSKQWGKWAYRSIYDGRWKLIVWAEKGKKPELYNVEADPHEEHDLFADPGQKERLTDLKGRLRERLKASADDAESWEALK